MANRLFIDPVEIKYLSNSKTDYGLIIKDDYGVHLIDDLSKNDISTPENLLKIILQEQPENWDIIEQSKENGCFISDNYYDYEEMIEKIKQIEKNIKNDKI